MRWMALAALGTVQLSVGACTDRPVGAVDEHPTGSTYTEIDLANRNTDILFVIDNSSSMSDEQEALIDNFDDFMAVLRGIEGGMPSVHIGVVTSDVGIAPYSYGPCQGDGDDGVLQNGEGACPIGQARFIVDENRGTTRSTNYSGTLEDAFACIAHVGTEGCGFEQHLESMRRALVDRAVPGGPNDGFLRDDAYLAVIVVSDEDDCSPADPVVFSASADDVQRFGAMTDFRCAEYGVTCAEGDVLRIAGQTYTSCVPRPGTVIRHPQAYVDALLALKADESLVLVSGITGNPSPFHVTADTLGNPELDTSCVRPATATTQASYAEPAVRLRWFLDQFPANQSTSASICDDDFRDTLVEIAGLLAQRLRPCLTGPVDPTDIDPNTPGLQVECQVSDLRFQGTDHETETPIARCESGATPCWRVVEDATTCAAAPHLEMIVERNGVDPPAGTQLVARCATE